MLRQEELKRQQEELKKQQEELKRQEELYGLAITALKRRHITLRKHDSDYDGESYDLVLMSSLLEQNNEEAIKGKIYLSPTGEYVVRNHNGIVHKGQLDQLNIKIFDLKDDLENKLIDAQFKSSKLHGSHISLKARILEVTSRAGHTHIEPQSTDNHEAGDNDFLINYFTNKKLQYAIEENKLKHLVGKVLIHTDAAAEATGISGTTASNIATLAIFINIYSKLIHPTLAAAAKVLTIVGQPILDGLAYVSLIGTAALGVRIIVDAIGTALNPEAKQRKTRYAGALILIGLVAAAVVLSAGIIAAGPLAVPLTYLALVSVAITRNILIYVQIEQNIKKEKDIIKRLEKKISSIGENPYKTEHEINIQNACASSIRSLKNNHEHEAINRKYARINFAIQATTIIAVGLLIGSVFFPPLILPTLGILLGCGIANYKSQRIQSKALAKFDESAKERNNQEDENAIIIKNTIKYTTPGLQLDKIPNNIANSEGTQDSPDHYFLPANDTSILKEDSISEEEAKERKEANERMMRRLNARKSSEEHEQPQRELKHPHNNISKDRHRHVRFHAPIKVSKASEAIDEELEKLQKEIEPQKKLKHPHDSNVGEDPYRHVRFHPPKKVDKAIDDDGDYDNSGPKLGSGSDSNSKG